MGSLWRMSKSLRKIEYFIRYMDMDLREYRKYMYRAKEKKQYYLTLYFYLFHKIILSYSIYPCIKHKKTSTHTGQHIQTIFIEKHVQSLLNFYEFSR